ELARLSEIFSSKKAELVLVYGRRRVGKSRLLVEAIKDENALYLLGDKSKSILDILARQTGEKFVRFRTWDDFFEFLLVCKYDVIVIDEFQYLCEVEKAWPTILSRWWEKISRTNKKIILSGSTISAIYKVTRGYGSALYGRLTAEMKITQLGIADASKFFPNYSPQDVVKAYCILGGIPRYLEEFQPDASVEENIKRKILEKSSFLYNEPTNLLFEEFRDVSPYVAILQAITNGKVRFSEIADESKIESHKLPKYLTILERVEIIEKEIPVTVKKTRTKTTRYKLADNFYAFWFAFLSASKQMIERGLSGELYESLKPQINAYYGHRFEEVCREYLAAKKPVDFTRIGPWWHKDTEIDAVAYNEKTGEILFAECKWKD
ncbi:MAG TPA: ATP-binding protein, partial [Candidatus Norongarragalinales archaeon]|nr:ATP-binding protein [Candidatus Norongarragalinales archaeon]